MQTVYIETTIPSHLAAHPSRQEPMATHQTITHEWWNNQKHRFLLYSSDFVRRKATGGDPNAAQRRLGYLTNILELDVPDQLDYLETELIGLFQLPARAAADASHLGIVILHRIDYLLTWNCAHLANATLQKELHQYCLYHNLHYPIVCTPETLIQLHP